MLLMPNLLFDLLFLFCFVFSYAMVLNINATRCLICTLASNSQKINCFDRKVSFFQARRAERKVSEGREVLDSNSVLATATINLTSISASEAAVTTAQPTITTLPHHPSGLAIHKKNKLNYRPAKQSHLQTYGLTRVVSDCAENSVSNHGPTINKHSLQHQAHVNIKKPSKHGISSGSKDRTMVAVCEDLKQEKKDSACNASAMIKEKEESENEEIDIDIENDDGDDNAILQSRSTSPSSVYSRLLQQANVQPLDTEDQSKDNDELQKESKEGSLLKHEGSFDQEVKKHGHPEDNDSNLIQMNDGAENSSSGETVENEEEFHEEEEALTRPDAKPVGKCLHPSL